MKIAFVVLLAICGVSVAMPQEDVAGGMLLRLINLRFNKLEDKVENIEEMLQAVIAAQSDDDMDDPDDDMDDPDNDIGDIDEGTQLEIPDGEKGDKKPDPAGQGPEGKGPEGQGPEGQGPEGQGPEGQEPEGQKPEGQGQTNMDDPPAGVEEEEEEEEEEEGTPATTESPSEQGSGNGKGPKEGKGPNKDDETNTPDEEEEEEDVARELNMLVKVLKQEVKEDVQQKILDLGAILEDIQK